MVNRDIVFSFDENKYEHLMEDIKDVWVAREYIYNFTFNFTVNNLEAPINNIIIYKNGEVYKDYKINQRSSIKYEIKDDNWLGFGNYNYAVELILEGGRTFKNDFYFKIVYSNVLDDIKVRSFSTYGLHENYSYLDIILNLQTEYQIDKILLYTHILPLTEIDEHSRISKESLTNNHYDSVDIKWSYLGTMEIKDYQYFYRQLLFDTTLKEVRTVLYKAVIITTNGITKPVIMSTLIQPNSLSLNQISYMNADTDEQYGIYGGIVGKIDNNLDNNADVNLVNPEYNGKIFEMVIDKRDKYKNFIEIKVDNYLFHAEKFSTEYLRKKFRKHATNKNPNSFVFKGKGIITKVIDVYRNIVHKDICTFVISLYCGDDIFTSFTIQPQHDNTLVLSTRKTGNSIVKYSKDKTNITFDSTYIDKTVDADALTGYFTLNKKKNELTFNYPTSDYTSETIPSISKMPVPIGTLNEKYFQYDYVAYNDTYFFFVKFDEVGIHLVQYDGTNYDKFDYDVRLTEETLQYVRTHDIGCFDKKDNLTLKFLNFDGKSILQKVMVENYELSVINCNDMVTNIYGSLRTKLVAYIQDIPDIIVDGVTYELKYNTKSAYKTISYGFVDMGYTDFNLKFSAQMFSYKIKIPIIAKFNNSSTNVNFRFNADMEVTCREDCLIYDDNFSEGNPRYDIDIDNVNVTYHAKDNGLNLIPQTGYESLNDRFFVKVSKPYKTKSIDDYAIFRNCNLYYGSINLYAPKPQDFYGNTDKRTSFTYKDLCRARVYEINENIYIILNRVNGKLIRTTVNVLLKKQIGQEIIDTDVYYNDLYTYSQKQLQSFDMLLSKAYLYDTVERDMYIFSISDFDKLYCGGYDNVYHQMQSITSLSGIVNDDRKGYAFKYSYQYPLNIKNRNLYLNDMVINEKGE